MFVFISLEASQSRGKTYRLAIGAYIAPLASMMTFLSRLF